MTRRTTKLQPLPKKFNLSDYELSNHETNRSLIANLLFKISFLRDDIATANISSDMSSPMTIQASNPLGFINSFPLTVTNPKNGVDHLITPHICPLELFDLQNKLSPPNLIKIGVNLGEATDDELVNEFRRLIPLWRQQSAQPEPTKNETGKVGPSTIRRIIEYKVLPMIDLMVWAQINGFKYSAEQLSRVLFPEELVTAKQMAETRIPFTLGFANSDYQDMLRLWLDQTGADGKQNGDRLVRDECLSLT
ncbi:DUF6387 family protein [Aeromonas caviae]|uniref:DUF6387 family protein n=1 Tax=Aeromonas caviae TaxID=648 RepID=UPI002B4A2B96|nr:DUF6387 family protein [Aeromonas caviae]